MRRNCESLFEEIAYGKKKYVAESLSDYVENFREANIGRKGLITRIPGLYKINFVYEEKYFPQVRHNIGMCFKHPDLYNSYVELGYSISNPANTCENLLVGLDIMSIIRDGDNNENLIEKYGFLIRKTIKPILNPVIYYDKKARLHIVQGWEKSQRRENVQLKLVVNN